MTKVLADMPNKETMSSIYEAIADMSDHHLKVASSYEELEKILDERNMKMKVKRVEEIAYGDQIAVELDINGKWQKGYGTIVVIKGYKFIFVPRKYSNGINIEAYSLDSLQLFDSKPMSFTTAWLQCATKEGFMEATAPLAIRISKQLNKIKSLNGWKKIFKGEYLSAIAECGARSEKERRLLKEFDSKGA